MIHYILFERSDDPHRELPVAVYRDMASAERAQLRRQQKGANEANKSRKLAFEKGQSCGRLVLADDYKQYFNIKEVKQ